MKNIFDEVIPTPDLGGFRISDRFNRRVDMIPDPPGGAGGGASVYPFQITDSTSTLGSPQIDVNYGTMQDMVPSGLSGHISVGSAGTWNVYLDTTVDINGNVTAVAGTVTQSAMPANTDYDGYILLGQVVVAVVSGNLAISAINQAASHSLRCGISGRQVVSGSLVYGGTFEFWGF
jgi:hypothetical protein